MKSRWQLGVAVALGLAAVLVYMLLQTPEYDEPAYFEDVARLQQIRQLDSQWELDVMKARLEMLQGYDMLVAPLADMARLPRQLHPGAGNAALAASIHDFLAELDAKAVLVESFKSRNALFRNSLAYLVTMADDVELYVQRTGNRRDSDVAFMRAMRETLLETMEFIDHVTDEDHAAVEQKLAQLKAAARGQDARLRGMADDFDLHVRIVVGEHLAIKRLIVDITDAPTDVRLDRIDALLAGELRDASRRVRQQRICLLLVSAALSGMLLYAALRLLRNHALINRYNAELQKANDTLEAAVRSRTEELSRANLRLQAEMDERMQLESRVVQTEKLASIGQLAAGVAHEINNPLGFLSSNFGMLEEYLRSVFDMLSVYEAAETGMDENTAALVRCAREQSQLAFLRKDMSVLMAESREGMERVGQIVQSLKDFSRADREQQWEWADLHRGIDSTMTILAGDIRKVADLVREYGELPSVQCVPSQVNQVIMNLLVNAVHATGPERGRIVVRTGAADGHAWIEVQDSGCGIAADVLPRIFDPFFTTKAIGKGTGLGLSLSYGIMQRHRGRIDVTTAPGEGSTFRVVLPVCQQLAAA